MFSKFKENVQTFLNDFSDENFFRNKITQFLLYLLVKTNPKKDRKLAYKLHEIAVEYE